ncbi:MAG: ATP-dependent DNA ligase [Desulfobacterales bacterium]
MASLLWRLAKTSEQIRKTSGRLEKIEMLANCLRRLSIDELDLGIAYLSGVLPQGRIGLGPSAVRNAYPKSAADQPTITLVEVDEAFEKIGRTSGPGSKTERVNVLRVLLEQATKEEQDFLSRLLVGEIRQGALEGLMMEAMGNAVGISAEKIRKAAMLSGDLSAVARAAFEEGTAGLERFAIRLFNPLQPMLAQTAESVTETLDRLGHAAFEWKLDGVRIQVHKQGDRVVTFTRRQKDVTDVLPEIEEAVRSLPAETIVLDGEVLALKPDGTPHPFQYTMRRFGRKTKIETMRSSHPLTPFFFDCLYFGNRSLIDRSNEERFSLMLRVVPSAMVTPRIVTSEVKEAEAFLKEALQHGHEGLVAKSPDSPYQAGRRGYYWLKIKHAKTLDLVVLAAEWGMAADGEG